MKNRLKTISPKKKSRKLKKSSKLISVKKLQENALNYWKSICLKRDGVGCQVQKHFPQIKVSHSTNYQVDHCITRSNHLLKLEPKNGTVVCSACNRAKHYCNKSVGRAIDDIVIKREGLDVFTEMVRIDMAKTANPNWCKRWWIEEQIEKLTKELAKYGT